MSFITRFVRSNSLSTIKNNVVLLCSRNSSFKGSEIFEGYEKHPNVEIVKNPPEWIYVEALLPLKSVPVPKNNSEYRSSWKLPTINKENCNYVVCRNKNHMIPVYLKETHRGLRKITIVKRIDGNIWELHEEIKKFVETETKREIVTRVNELSSQIHLRGDFVEIVYNFLLKKGF